MHLRVDISMLHDSERGDKLYKSQWFERAGDVGTVAKVT